MTSLEQELTNRELLPFAEILARRFVQRRDMYPRQYDGARPYFTVREPLTQPVLLMHLRGQVTLGTYLLNEESQGRFLVLDADDEVQWQRLWQAALRLQTENTLVYLERSRRGGHGWMFFDSWLPGELIRRFAQGLVEAHQLEGVEIYPKQAVLSGGPGSLIRLPFGVHQGSGQRYGFYYPTGEALAPTLRQQIKVLENPLTIPKTAFPVYVNENSAQAEEPEFERVEVAGGSVSQRVKAAIDVAAFVGRFVELSPTGRGQCPFHDDYHASFGVNEQGNYWHCYAGCGGGSVIDFWMRYRNCDFKTAVSELAQMLLK